MNVLQQGDASSYANKPVAAWWVFRRCLLSSLEYTSSGRADPFGEGLRRWFNELFKSNTVWRALKRSLLK
jgi:hypothetical protein